MNAHQLFTHYETANRIIHHEKPPPVFAIKESCFEGLALFQRDIAEIERLKILYPVASVPIPEKKARPNTRGFRLKIEMLLPEIQKLLDIGDSALDIAERLKISETAVRRAARYLDKSPTYERSAVAVIGTHKITGETVEFLSMGQAEKYGGFQGSKIGLCLTGRASHHKGYIWRKK